MLTLTAPSDQWHHRWNVNGARAHRELCGCDQHLGSGLGLWNASASRRWNRLRTALDREYPGMVYLRAVEVQERGALHLHVILWTPHGIDLERVQTLALAAGFGCVLDYAPAEPGSRRAAYYVAKYVTKACDSREVVPWDLLNMHTGEISPADAARYRTWSSSRDWGLTMKVIEEAIRLAAARRAALERDELVPPPCSESVPACPPDQPPG